MFFFCILRNYSNSKIQNHLLKIQNKELTTALKTSETNSPRQKKLPDGKDKKQNKISKWLELTAFKHLRFLVCSMPITCKSSKWWLFLYRTLFFFFFKIATDLNFKANEFISVTHSVDLKFYFKKQCIVCFNNIKK